MTMAPVAIQIDGLEKTYQPTSGPVTVFKGLNLTVRRGEIGRAHV